MSSNGLHGLEARLPGIKSRVDGEGVGTVEAGSAFQEFQRIQGCISQIVYCLVPKKNAVTPALLQPCI